MDLSIIIPAYNEEKRIGKSLNRIQEYLTKKKINYEIIIVDDGSKDDTIKVIDKFKGNIRLLKNEINSGKGFSVKKGIMSAQYGLILFTDADLATPIEELDQMKKSINEGYDIVIASRNMPESNIFVKPPSYKQLLGKTFPLFVRFLLFHEIRDTQCGFKLFKKKVARRISKLQRIYGFCFDVELLFIAKKFGYKIKEVPVKWVDQKGSKISPLKDAFKMLIDLIKIKYNGLVGKYK